MYSVITSMLNQKTLGDRNFLGNQTNPGPFGLSLPDNVIEVSPGGSWTPEDSRSTSPSYRWSHRCLGWSIWDPWWAELRSPSDSDWLQSKAQRGRNWGRRWRPSRERDLRRAAPSWRKRKSENLSDFVGIVMMAGDEGFDLNFNN